MESTDYYTSDVNVYDPCCTLGIYVKNQQRITIEDLATARFNLVYGHYPEKNCFRATQFFIDTIIHRHPETYSNSTYKASSFGVFENQVIKGITIRLWLIEKLAYKLVASPYRIYAFRSKFEELVFVRTMDDRLRAHAHRHSEAQDTGNGFAHPIFNATEFNHAVNAVEAFRKGICDLTDEQKSYCHTGLFDDLKRKRITLKNAETLLEDMKKYIVADWRTVQLEWISAEWEKYSAMQVLKNREAWNALSREEQIRYYRELISVKEAHQAYWNTLTSEERHNAWNTILDTCPDYDNLKELSEEEQRKRRTRIIRNVERVPKPELWKFIPVVRARYNAAVNDYIGTLNLQMPESFARTRQIKTLTIKRKDGSFYEKDVEIGHKTRLEKGDEIIEETPIYTVLHPSLTLWFWFKELRSKHFWRDASAFGVEGFGELVGATMKNNTVIASFRTNQFDTSLTTISLTLSRDDERFQYLFDAIKL